MDRALKRRLILTLPLCVTASILSGYTCFFLLWRSLPSVFQLVEAFVKARVGMVEACIRGDVEEDDLESPDRIEEQLEQLPGLFRCRS